MTLYQDTNVAIDHQEQQQNGQLSCFALKSKLQGI